MGNFALSRFLPLDIFKHKVKNHVIKASQAFQESDQILEKGDPLKSCDSVQHHHQKFD
jgi:hypothetical protein